MSRKVFFLDASALIHQYAPPGTDSESRAIRTRIKNLLALAAESPERIVLQVPNICMAECAGAFAKFCFESQAFGSGEFARDAYRRLRDALLRDVSRDRLIHSYELKRGHFVGIEDIFMRDYELPPPRQGSRLSSHDALILSMANEYRLARGVRISTQNAV